jgi:hypothetical protein
MPLPDAFARLALKIPDADRQTRLLEVLGVIGQTIENDPLPVDMRLKLGEAVVKLSPKKTGTFLEGFTRFNHTLDGPMHGAHDASLQGRPLEIKASRVLYTPIPSTADNQLDLLLNENRELVPFARALDVDFDCNLQQVKPAEFDELHYALFFQDVIVCFRAEKACFDLQKTTSLIEGLAGRIRQLPLPVERHEAMETFLASFVPQRRSWLDLREMMGRAFHEPESLALLEGSGIFDALFEQRLMGYSDRQHRGNQGEGQFHIQPQNLFFHLAYRFSGAYHYGDFARYLKSVKTSSEPVSGEDIPKSKM